MTTQAIDQAKAAAFGEQMLGEAGLIVQDVTRVEGEIVNTYYLCTRA